VRDSGSFVPAAERCLTRGSRPANLPRTSRSASRVRARGLVHNLRGNMRKVLIAALLAASCLFTSCAAGPHQLRRTVDDWDHEMYVKSPWVDAVLWIVPVFPIMNFGAFVGDFLVTDAYAFWIKDAWDGKGTGFKHYEVKPTDGQMSSLWNEDAGWLRIR
jgi:hypothetical protein